MRRLAKFIQAVFAGHSIRPVKHIGPFCALHTNTPKGKFVERLDDNGWHPGLIAIAPHGGAIEPHTDQQAERVASQLAGKGVSSWRCKGWRPTDAARLRRLPLPGMTVHARVLSAWMSPTDARFATSWAPRCAGTDYLGAANHFLP
jgi:hypothetical protein